MSLGSPEAARNRGEPLLVLGAIVGGWLILRILLWQSPFDGPLSVANLPGTLVTNAVPGKPATATATATVARAGGTQRDDGPSRGIPGPNDAPDTQPLPAPWLSASNTSRLGTLTVATAPVSRIVGRQFLLAAAFSHMELAPEIAAHFVAALPAEPQRPAVPDQVAPRSERVGARWSGDTWLLLRNDSSGPLTPGEPPYGRSQAGAILRYRLAPSSPHRPSAYVRATRALVSPQETEVAAGLGARPLGGVPLSLAGELRVSQGPAGREVRPAGFVVTELPPATLPLGLRAEAYAAAGYVGGRFATAFADGQARVDSHVVRLDDTIEIRAGGGVWGGAQKHAARLDVGPSATVRFRLGGAASRVAIDYRWRVAGDAEPKSGPALTFSAGF